MLVWSNWSGERNRTLTVRLSDDTDSTACAKAAGASARIGLILSTAVSTFKGSTSTLATRPFALQSSIGPRTLSSSPALFGSDKCSSRKSTKSLPSQPQEERTAGHLG